MGIGSKLEVLMKERHTNANELALQIGTAPTTIYSMIKRDSKKADIDVLLNIAAALHVDVSYFGDVDVVSSPEKKADLSDRTASMTYEELTQLISSNGQNLTSQQRMDLIQLISSGNFDQK